MFKTILTIIILSFSLNLFPQNSEELKEIKKQLENKFWKLKEKNIRERSILKKKLNDINESLKNSYDKRNSLIEEFYLIQENLNKVKETLLETENEKNSFISQADDFIIEEKEKLKSTFPIVIEKNTTQLNEIEKITVPLEKIKSLLNYKNDFINLGEEVILYNQKIINPQSQEPVNVKVLKVGLVGSLFTGEKDFTGFLIRKSDLTGIAYDWEIDLPNNKKNLIKKSVIDMINSLKNENNKNQTVAVALDPVQAGKKLKSLLDGQNKNIFQSIFKFLKAGGVIMYPLLLLGFFSLLITIERLLHYKKYNYHRNPKLVKFIKNLTNLKKEEPLEFSTFINNSNNSQLKPNPVYEFIKNLSSVKIKTSAEIEKVIDENVFRYETILNSRLSTLGVLGTIAPLLGLLGTVSGMIALFDVITIYGTSNPKILAGGISVALITTQTGLALAIPILLIHHFLQRKKTKIVSFLEDLATKIINHQNIDHKENTKNDKS